MRIRVKGFILGFVFVCLAATSGYAQQKSDASAASLGDVARALKAQKSKEAKPAMVITNDNLPSNKEGASEFSPAMPEKKSTEAAPEASKAASDVHDEKYYRARLSELQDNLNTHKRELEVLQEKLGQNQTQYYPDPNKTLQQEYSRSDVNKLTADIDAKKQQIANDERAIDDLRDQLRHENGDPSWLR